MADKTIRTDDLDETTEGVERIDFGYRGVDYEIDLNPEHTKELDELVSRYIDHGRRKPRASVTAPRRPRTTSTAAPETQRIREWAAGRGIDLPARGPVPKDVRDRYTEAQAEDHGPSDEQR